MPRVSVLLPTHNRADIVQVAVQSVLDQTEADFELLVVADGCDDGTVALIAGLGDARIRIFDLPKAPHYGYANRNIALREARGDFVAYAAHDDLWLRDHLEQLIRALEVSHREWIYSRPLWVSTDGIIVPFSTNLTVADELEHFLTVSNSVPASCVLFRRSCLQQYGYVPENFPSAADWRHWIAIIEGGQRRNLAYLPTPTCLHFAAAWRKSRHSAVEEVRVWLDVADSCSWWPSILRWQIPPGMPEQKVIAGAMRSGGTVWLQDLRAAVDAVIDRLAWDDIRVVRPRLHGRDLETRQLNAQVADLESRVTDLQSQVADLEAQLADVRDGLAASRNMAESNASQLEVADRELHACRHRLSVTLASTSWRITAPMRTLKQLLGRSSRRLEHIP
jgi:hypothetical protein